MIDLFENENTGGREILGMEAFVLKGFALPIANELLAKIAFIQTLSPFRHMTTPGGHTMSVGLTNCGQLGWTSDRRGYKYSALDPATGNPWPVMPNEFLELAKSAASEAGFVNFVPDACLINKYIPGTKLSLHQDKDEQDLRAPIVSVSLGIPAVFQFGGFERGASTIKVPLFHGDVVVWGGVDRLRFHGILPLKPNSHSILGEQRINLTFRKASPFNSNNFNAF
ncbi:MAG: alpha-ketoglutarate-dependent dioxygenase AlkB [Cellvibrio sp. 79]|nr:MAG: alpha-ketoglutarate-dependent dioxygenase AlkB [Cellvibrio sp. 79]